MKLRNPCAKCDFYNSKTNICQSKKVANVRFGKVSLFDRLFCSPFTIYKSQVRGEHNEE